GHTLFREGLCCWEIPHIKGNCSLCSVRFNLESDVASFFGKASEVVTALECIGHAGREKMGVPLTPHYGEQRLIISHLIRQGLCTDIGFADFRGAIPLGGD
ncbi:MAG: hypothetical protein V3W19_10100, partial [Desulfatiglandales bacterium]